MDKRGLKWQRIKHVSEGILYYLPQTMDEYVDKIFR